MPTRSTTMRALVLAADPDYNRNSRIVPEYEVTTNGPPRGQSSDSGMRSYENGLQVFKGDYQERGPYREDAVDQNELEWNGVEITWNGTPLTWD